MSDSDLPLHFNSTQDAFAYACKYMDTSVAPDHPTIGIVLAVKGRSCIVKLANEADPAVPSMPVPELIAKLPLEYVCDRATVAEGVPSLKRGDLVMIVATKEASALGKVVSDGVIVAKVKPVYLVTQGVWLRHAIEH